jgi:hypothetical protein
VASWGGWRRVSRELVLIAVFLAVYEEIRDHIVQAGGAAASHALSVVSAERVLGIFHERAVQALFTGSDTVTDAFNVYYGGTHFLVPAAALAWLLLRHPGRYAVRARHWRRRRRWRSPASGSSRWRRPGCCRGASGSWTR